MSKELNDFAEYFSKGLERGSNMAARWEANKIARERNKLAAARQAMQDARENRKMGIYSADVAARIELNKARAQKALGLTGGKGGGGGGGNLDQLDQEAAAMGIIKTPTVPSQNITIKTEAPESDDGGAPVMPFKKGGMVRKMAGGGSIEADADMSIAEAMSYRKKKEGGGGGGGMPGLDKLMGGMMKKKDGASGAGGKSEAEGVIGGGASSSGGGGGSNFMDMFSGTGAKYAKGGAVQEPEDLTEDIGEQAIDTLRTTPSAPVAPVDPRQQGGDYGSANAGTGSSGDAGGGVSGGTGGVGGSATDGSGGSAAAGVGGDDGGTYRRGGRVRRFQSGGRVMEAIDTGTSGPGSGFGYRAAPPARRY